MITNLVLNSQGDHGNIVKTSIRVILNLYEDPQNAVEQDGSTTPQVGYASEDGKFISPNSPNGDEGNTGRARAPSERETAGSENGISEQALLEHIQRAAEDIQTPVVSDAPEGASMLQSDVEGLVAASAKERTTVPDVPLMPRQIAPENKAEERHAGIEPEPEGRPVEIVVNEQRGMQTPDTGIPTKYSTNHIFQGDNRRSTINGIMDVLGTQSKLEMQLKELQASPIRVIVEAVEKASLDILYMYTKESEVHIEDLKQRLADAEAQNLIARTQSFHETINV
jgi:hypothetical protein